MVFWECSYEKNVVSYQFLFKFEALTAKSHFLTKTLCIGWDVKKLNTWSHFLLLSNYFHFNLALHGEWPSGLRLCNQNQKVLASNPTRRAAGVRDPTLLCGSRWPSGPIFKNIVINIAYKDFLAATLNDLLEALQKGEQRWENVRKKSDVNFYCIVYYESRCRNFITRNNDWTKITLSFKYYFSKVKKSGEIKF